MRGLSLLTVAFHCAACGVDFYVSARTARLVCCPFCGSLRSGVHAVDAPDFRDLHNRVRQIVARQREVSEMLKSKLDKKAHVCKRVTQERR